MVAEKLPKSTRKFIRLQKALIRRRFLDYEKQKEMIEEIYDKLLNKQLSQENIKKVEVKKKEKPKKTIRVNKKVTKIGTVKRKT